MLVTDDDAVFARIHVLRDHGRAPGDVAFFNQEVAFKYKMSSLQAALGQAQLDRLDELVAGKRRIFGWYRDRLGHLPHLQLNAEPPGTFNSYWMSTVVLDEAVGLTKEEVAARLAAQGVATRPFFHQLSTLPAYADAPDAQRAQDANATSRRLGRFGLNLPSALRLTEADVEYACARLLEVLG